MADCLTNQPLSGVTVQLLDSNGNVIQDHHDRRTRQLQIQRSCCRTETYGVSEILPPGFVHNDEDVGNAGGTIAGDASIVRILLGDGTNGNRL